VRRHTMPTQGDTACGCLTVTGEEAASAAICFCAASRLLRYATWLCPRALATAPVPTVLPAYACTEDTYMLSRFLTWVAISNVGAAHHRPLQPPSRQARWWQHGAIALVIVHLPR
jgi:hypothetical protein